MVYAYIRVSTKDQNLDRQKIAVREYMQQNFDGKGFMFATDKQSGKNFERKGYQSLKKKIRSNDTLIIHSIDRLGRNYEGILEEWQWFKKKNINIVVLDMPLLNTTNTVNGLDGRFIADLVLQILSYIAEKEREKIKIRQREGIDAAKQKGVKFGRPLKTPSHFEAIEQYCHGLLSFESAWKMYGLSRGKFARDLKIYRKEKIYK